MLNLGRRDLVGGPDNDSDQEVVAQSAGLEQPLADSRYGKKGWRLSAWHWGSWHNVLYGL